MAEGYGVDLTAIYQLLAQVAATVTDHTQLLNSQSQVLNNHTQVLLSHSEMLNSHSQVLNSHAAALQRIEQRLTGVDGSVAGLTDAVHDYHGAVMGHGISLTELDDRVRRLEDHTGFPSAA